MEAMKIDGKTIELLMSVFNVSEAELARRWDREHPERWLHKVQDARKNGVEGFGVVCHWLGRIACQSRLSAGEWPVYESLVWKAHHRDDILQSYEDDLLVHDRQHIAGMKPGDEFLWVGRSSCSVIMPKNGTGLAIEQVWDRSPEFDSLYAHVEVTRAIAGFVFGKISWLRSAEARCLAESFTRPAIPA